jgi:hypothetical protein
VTPHQRSRTLKLLERALALSLSHPGHSAGCSQMGRCCRPSCGWHPPRAAAQQTPPSATAQQTPPAVAPQTLAIVAQ